MYVPLDRGSAEPLSRQIASYLEELMRRGHIAPGGKLPSLRSFARSLGVARETIESAYGDLAARGLVTVVPGQGAIVRRKLPDPVALALPFPEARSRDPLPQRAWHKSSEPKLPPIDLRGDAPALLHASTATMRRALHEAIASRGPLFGAAPAGGEATLRRAASRVLSFTGVLHSEDEIAILDDFGEAVRAVVEQFVPPGGLVLCDGPFDPRGVRAIRESGRRLVVTEPGELTETLRRRLARGGPRLVLVPSDHGVLPRPRTTLSRRRALLDLVREAGLPLLEDVTRTAMFGPGEEDVPLAVLDRSGRVTALLDLGDEVGGGFEGAAIAGTPKIVERLRSRRRPGASSLNRLAERALAARIEDPGRARHLRTVHELRTLLADSIVRALQRRLPMLPSHEFSTGLRTVRLNLPETVAASDLARSAERRGVLVASSGDCGLSHSDDFLLLDLTRHEEGELLEGIRRLGVALDELLDARASERSPTPEGARS